MSYEQHFLAGKWSRIKHGPSQNKIQVHIQVKVLRACRGSNRCINSSNYPLQPLTINYCLTCNASPLSFAAQILISCHQNKSRRDQADTWLSPACFISLIHSDKLSFVHIIIAILLRILSKERTLNEAYDYL